LTSSTGNPTNGGTTIKDLIRIINYMETVPTENTTMSVIRESEKRKNEKKQLLL
jgi:hypothetical protein